MITTQYSDVFDAFCNAPTVGQVFRQQAKFWRSTLSYTEYCRKIHNSHSFARCEARSTGIDLSDYICLARAHLVWKYIAMKTAKPPKPDFNRGIDAKNLSIGELKRELPAGKHQSASFHKDDVFHPQSMFTPVLKVDDAALHAINQLTEAVKSFSNGGPSVTVEHTMPLFESSWAQLKSALGLDKCGGKLVVSIIVIVVISYICHKYDLSVAKTFFACASVVVAVNYGSEMLTEYLSPIVDTVYSYFSPAAPPAEEFEPQLGVSSIAPLIVGLIYAEAGHRSYDKENVNIFLKTVGEMPKLENGIVKFIDYIIMLAQKTINSLRGAMGCDPIRLKESLYPELDNVTVELHKIISEFRAGAPYNYDNAMRIFELEKRASKLVSEIPNSSEYVEYKRAAMSLAASIRPYVSKMERNNIVGNGPRREPLGIMIGGPTAVGKSTCMVPILLAVNAQVLPKQQLEAFSKNHNDFIWNFIPENPFHDSYHGQFNTIVDEAGSHRDAAGTPDAGAQGILRMINTANFPLHMASLEDKGSVNFNSELVWATTNRVEFDFKSMYLPEAYARRFKVSVLHVPKKEYCMPGTVTSNLWDRRLDHSKIPHCPEGFTMDINEYYPYDYRPGKACVTGPAMSYDELVDLIVRTYKGSTIMSDKLLAFHTMQKNKYISMRDDFKPQAGWNPFDEDWKVEGLGLKGLADAMEIEEDVLLSILEEEEKIHSTRNITLNDVRELIKRSFCTATFKAECKWRDVAATALFNKTNVAILLAGISMVALGWAIAKPALFDQSGDVRPITKPGARRPRFMKVVSKAGIITGRSNSAQAGVSQNAFDVARKVAKRNVYKADCEGRPLGFFTFLLGRMAICPEHFFFAIEDWIERKEICENPTLNFHRVGAPGTGFKVKLDDMSVTVLDSMEEDQCVVIFPKVVMNHPDIMRFLLPDDNKLHTSKFSAALMRPDDDGSFSLVTTTAIPVGQKSYAGYSASCCFQYPIATRKGECGSPLFGLHVTGQPFLVGIHVAGSNGSSGISSKISLDAMKKIIAEHPSEVYVGLPEEPDLDVQMGEKFLVSHEVEKLRVATLNQVVPSPLHEAWGPSDYAPSALVPRLTLTGKVDPWHKARSKYSNHSEVMNLHILDSVCQETISSIIYCSSRDDPWEPKVFTAREAIEGFDGVRFCDGVPRKTSPGYPFCLTTKQKGKYEWFGDDGPYDFDSPKSKDLLTHIDKLVKSLEQGIRCNVMFADFLKDERRLKHKVESCSTRLISASPLDFLVLCKMYFGDLVRWLMQNRILNSMAMGINPYSSEWEVLAKNLHSVEGDNMIFGDFSGFDGSLSVTIMYKFLELAETFYHNAKPEDRVVRAALFEDIINSRHVTNGKDSAHSLVYEWFGSNPSGNAITTPLNSFSNILIIKYGIVLCHLKHWDIETFKANDYFVEEIVNGISEHIRIIVFGDDNGIAVSDDWRHIVDQEKLTVAMAEFGFKYTDEAKGAEVHSHRPLSECSFLKRTWNSTPHGRLAALDLGVILEMPYWTKKTAPSGSVEATVDTALMELALHGECVFEKWAPVIANASVARIGHRPCTNYRTNLALASNCQNEY